MGDLSDHERVEVKRLTGLLMELVRMEVAEEREACAKVCEEIFESSQGEGLLVDSFTRAIRDVCVEAIRDRGKR